MHAPLGLTPVPGRPVHRQPLTGDWALLETPAGAVASPAALAGRGPWMAAQVPGTVAQALQAAGNGRRRHRARCTITTTGTA